MLNMIFFGVPNISKYIHMIYCTVRNALNPCKWRQEIEGRFVCRRVIFTMFFNLFSNAILIQNLLYVFVVVLCVPHSFATTMFLYCVYTNNDVFRICSNLFLLLLLSLCERRHDWTTLRGETCTDRFWPKNKHVITYLLFGKAQFSTETRYLAASH